MDAGRKRKAKQSLRAALLLLDRGFVDDAASRFYYALFQAAVHGFESRGMKPSDFRDGATWWEHRTVARRASLLRGRQDDVSLLDDMRALREQSDYDPSPVARGELESRRCEAVRFVEEETA